MRRVLEPDHDLLGEDEPPRDLVLGAPALIGIFLAVVLVCAVCFGFGYSSGHGFHLGSTGAAGTSAPVTASAGPMVKPSPAAPLASEDAADAAPHPDAAPSASEPVPELSPTGVPVTKPAPGVASTNPAGPAQMQAQPLAPAHAETAEAARSGAAAPVRSASTASSALAPAPSAASPAAPAAAGANLGLMVQIAAVTQAADAETLARALRHDGFDAIVRTTTGDPYFHVQVGPYASYEAAKATRSRLASDGYTAFIRR